MSCYISGAHTDTQTHIHTYTYIYIVVFVVAALDFSAIATRMGVDVVDADVARVVDDVVAAVAVISFCRAQI